MHRTLWVFRRDVIRVAVVALLAFGLKSFAVAADPEPGQVAEKAIAAVGGEAKLLRLFRMKERYNAGAVAADVDKSTPRESVLEPPEYWWVDGKDRKQEPAKFAVWGWTLGVLLDPKTVLETIPGVDERSRKTLGLRASGTVNPPMDLYFDSETFRLVRLDWREDVYRYSDWREVDGTGYHGRTAIFKKGAAEPWFHHEVVSVERLPALPEGLSR